MSGKGSVGLVFGSEISWWRTHFGEEEINGVARAIRAEHISLGPLTAEFERQLGEVLGVPYVVATTSGSTALLLALLALDVGVGDEVIVPDRTWIATAHAARLLGARVVPVDVEAERPVLDVGELEASISGHTKAIVPVHLNGRSPDMAMVREVAARYGVSVVEDAAQALCSRNSYGLLGTQSEYGCFSLSVAKLISTGQGGFVVTSTRERYERLKLLRTHGVTDVLHASFTALGFNFRFTDVLAAIGIAQLERLQERVKKVQKIHELYAEGLQGLPFTKMIPVDVNVGELPIYVEVLCRERNQIVAYLDEHGIETRPFYPCVHEATYLGVTGDFPNSQRFAQQGLYLPAGPDQPLDNIHKIIDLVRRFRPKVA